MTCSWAFIHFLSLTPHEESKPFSGFSTFPTFQESWASQDLLSRSTTIKSSRFSYKLSRNQPTVVTLLQLGL